MMQDGTARILIVEDEPLVRLVIREFLRTQGFEVDEAQDGHEAVRKFHDTAYDLLLMDYHLPRMSGAEVLSEIREHFPETKAILLSGSAPDPELSNSGIRSLMKPFENAELLKLVRDTLQQQ